ncbi:MAG: hypothetical protein H0W33_09005 [Gammaproteobacteria bacterium]|nr:hypothetical protein [Gammaproteobacteria bacterium]
MPESSKTCASCLCGLAALSLGACASTETYDPEPKFSQFQSSPETVELTGSRLSRYGSRYELTRDSLSPTSVITRDYIDRYGESSLSRLMCKNFPNMVGNRSGRNSRGFRGGC